MNRWARAARLRRVLVGVFVAALGLLFVQSQEAQAKGPIRSPKPGSSHAAGRPVPLHVRTGFRGKVRVRLNGVLSHRELERPDRRVHRMQLSPSHGLRRGRNRLVVRIHRFHGRRRKEVIRFRVRRGGPLAAAGRDLHAPAGAPVQLDGTKSRPRRASRLRFRWRLAGADVGGPLPMGATRSKLKRRRSATPAFTPPRPGTYRFRLRVRRPNGRTGIDRVRVVADPPPALSLDTMAKQNGREGIRVGDAFYAADPGAWLQVVVLDRSLGTLLWKKSYDCDVSDESLLPICATTVQNDLKKKKISDNALVIASNQPESGGHDGAPLVARAALKPLKLPKQTYPAAETKLERGTYSAVGTTDIEGTANSGATNSAGSGAIRGLLIRNNALNYALSAPDSSHFETQAEGSDTARNVMEAGGHRYVADLGSAPGGYQVVVLNPRTLDGHSYFFATGGKKGAAALSVIRSMASALQGAAKRHDIVMLASRGRPALDAKAYEGVPYIQDLYLAIRGASRAVQAVGGTGGAFYRTISAKLYKGTSYTLIGRGGLGAAGGEERIGKTAGHQRELNAAPLLGTFKRTTADYGFALGDVANALPLGTHHVVNPGARLTETVLDPPTPWPDAGDPGRSAAVAVVGKLAGLGVEPRAQYYTQPYTTEYWSEAQKRIDGLAPPSVLPAGVTPADFTWARGELSTEIDWLLGEHAFVEGLAAPYEQISLRSWADLHKIAADINSKVKAPKESAAHVVAGALFDGAREALDAIPEVGRAFEVINAIYDAALKISELADGGEAGDSFESTVGEAGADLAERLSDAQQTLAVRYTNVVAADYGKLRTVGLCAAGSDACPADPGEWQFTSDDQTKMGQGLLATLQTGFYATVLPSRYDLFTVAKDGGKVRLENVTDARKWTAKAIGEPKPFGEVPDSAQFAVPSCLDMGDPRRSEWQNYALGHRTDSGTLFDPWKVAVPEDSVTDRLFAPVDEAHFPSKGGLGQREESFYLRSFKPRGFFNFPMRDTPMFWEGNTSPFRYCSD